MSHWIGPEGGGKGVGFDGAEQGITGFGVGFEPAQLESGFGGGSLEPKRDREAYRTGMEEQ
jgi:hypothetical protein